MKRKDLLKKIVVALFLFIGITASTMAQVCGTAVPWTNTAFTTQTGTFTTEFDAVPEGANMDGVVGLSNGSASTYSRLACAIQFNTDGKLYARNGSAYTAATALTYTAGTSYHVKMVVNVSTHKYDIYVTPSGGSQITLGTGYSFRTEQASVTQLNNRALVTITCGLTVSNFTAGNAPDTQAPTTPSNVIASNTTSSSTSLSWTASTDNIGVSGYDVYQNGALKTSVTSTSAAISGLSSGTTYAFTVKAKDAAGNVSAASSPVSVTTLTEIVCGNAVPWTNTAFTNQTGTFNAEFDVVPAGANMDGVVGLSNGSASTYSSLACVLQFATDGKIYARNAGAYASATALTYTAGTSYNVKMVVNVSTRKYDIYVTPSGGSQITLGTGYSFRTEQASVTQLNNRALVTITCGLIVSNFTLGSASVAVTGVSVNPTSAAINVGATTALTATVSPSNATNKTVSWSSSKISVATVSSSGVVTGIAAGTATITVKTQDGNKTATCAVTVNAPVVGNCDEPMPAGRSFWVYMTPCEAEALYNSADFAELKNYADNFVQNGMVNPISKIDHKLAWVGEAEAALESVSAVYMARKWGEFGGDYNSALAGYLNFVKSIWTSVTATPLSTWTYYSSANWYEGDISLRYWLHGAFASYDGIRDDLASSDRNSIDNWLRSFANTMWTSTENTMLYSERFKNRGTSAFGQCQLIALLLQDQPLFETYFNELSYGSGNKPRGFKEVLDMFGYTRNASCGGIPDTYGYPLELTYRDGIHGIIPIVHALNAMQNISHAARTGGSQTWDILYEPYNETANLNAMLDVWYRIGFGDLYNAFNNYARCVEGSSPFWDPIKYSLKGKVAESFAWLDGRYDNLDWGYISPMQKLWKFRAIQMRNMESLKSAEVMLSSGSKLAKSQLSIHVFPNPSKESVNVDISSFGNVSDVMIYDISGKLMYQNQHKPGVFDIGQNILNRSGVFIITVNDGNTFSYSKFEIIK